MCFPGEASSTATSSQFDADWSSTDSELRQMQVQYAAWFAVHMMSSMSLAGLDRTYGTIGEEVDRILRASEESPPSTNIVIDFALMRKIREASTSALQLEVDSAAPRISTICPEVLGATTEVLRAFLTSKKVPATPAFEVVLGVTDPDDRLRALGRRIGESDRIVTASLATYLALTLCDPYAYGVSGTRAVFTFVAFLILRCRLRKDKRGKDAVMESLTRASKATASLNSSSMTSADCSAIFSDSLKSTACTAACLMVPNTTTISPNCSTNTSATSAA